MEDNTSKLLDLQKKHMSENWSRLELVDKFSEYKNRTFAHYGANYLLVKIEPFIDTLKGQSIVTICDGRGIEALYLKEHGLKCTATDLEPVHLIKLRDNGFLDDIDAQNAEKMSLKDNTFDWSLVKAGLHHLQKPVIGIYEMLRVSRKGVIVIEAHDSFLLNLSQKFSKKVLDFEEAGNYVYRFRKREIEKICLSLGLKSFALYTYFLPYRKRYGSIKPGLNYNIHVSFFKLVNIFLKSQGNIFCAIIFKEEPAQIQIDILKKTGFGIYPLPENPYL